MSIQEIELVIAQRSGQGHVILRVATLDETPLQKSESHIFKSHEVSWLEYGPQIPVFSEWESDHA